MFCVLWAVPVYSSEGFALSTIGVFVSTTLRWYCDQLIVSD